MTDVDPFAVPLSTDPATIRQEQQSAVQLVEPDWRPIPGALDTNMLAVAAEVTAESRQAMAARIRSEILTWIGDLWGIHRGEGLPAQSTITVTALTDSGEGLEVGTTVYVGETECQTMGELVLAAGESGQVAIAATEVGVAPNGLDAAPGIDSLDWINTVTLDAPLADGQDPENDIEFGQKVREELQTYSEAIGLPADAVIFARRQPHVGWAYCIDHYDAVTGEANEELTFTVVVTDDLAGPLGPGVLADLRSKIAAKRATNYVIRVVNATYTPVDAVAQMTVDPQWVLAGATAAALANGKAAITDALRSAQWLTPSTGGLDASFVPPRRIHKNHLIARGALGEGILRVDNLVIGDGSSNYIDLASPVHLPIPGTITVTEAT